MAGITKLEAVNYMLVQAGEQPVVALTGAGLGTDTTMALFMLDVVTKESQERGLDENVYETIIPLNLADNSVPIPSNAIDAYLRDQLLVTDSSGELKGQMNVAIRDRKLYNVTSQSFDFSEFNKGEVEDQGGFRVVLKVYLDFEDLNPATKRMIMEECARRYQLATQGDQAVDGLMAQRTQLSRINSRANDFNNKARNLFDGTDPRRTFAVSRRFPYGGGSNPADNVRRGL